MACRDWYGTLKDYRTGLGGEVAFLDKEVFFWAAEDSHYDFGKGLRADVLGIMKNARSRRIRIQGGEKERCNMDVDFACR